MDNRPGVDAFERALAEFANRCSDLDDPDVMAGAWDQGPRMSSSTSVWLNCSTRAVVPEEK